MKFRRSILLCLTLLFAAGTASYAASELPSPAACIYNFPKGAVIHDNIATLFPQVSIGEYSCTVLSGGIASITGVLPAKSARESAYASELLAVLVKDEFVHTKTSYVSHLSLGKNIHYCGVSVSVHSGAAMPTRLNVCSSFMPYSRLNLSGRVHADISNAALDGAKIYTAGATVLNRTIAYGRETLNGGGYVTWEIAGPSTLLNDCHFLPCSGFNSAHGQEDKISGGFIFHAEDVEVENADESHSVNYSPVTILGDFVTCCPKCTPDRHVTFYSRWDEGNKKLNLPGAGMPLFISNSIDPSLPGVMLGIALNKLDGKGMEPMPATFNLQYQKLSGGKFDAVLHPDGRVYVYFFEHGGKAEDPLADARVITKPEKYGAADYYRLMPGAVLDMSECGDYVSLDNITAGTLTHGAGIVLVNQKQLITLTADKSIRHSIHGEADMIIKGEKDKPIYVSFERLLQPRVDKAQALYELKDIKAEHAGIYIGPGNIVGRVDNMKATMSFEQNVDVFNYGVLSGDICLHETCRMINSHYAGTHILKHKGCGDEKVKIPVKPECYPGTISGDVVLRDGSEFCNYGTVRGNITVGSNAVLYGCGTCLGNVTVNSGGVYYVDHSLHPVSETPVFVCDMSTDFNIRRPGNECKNLNLAPDALLAFRVSVSSKDAPYVLKIEEKVKTATALNVRVDIDGSILSLFTDANDEVSIPLVQVANPKNGSDLKRAKLFIASGAELVRDAKLVWDKQNGTLRLSVKLSKAAKSTISKASKKHRSRRY